VATASFNGAAGWTPPMAWPKDSTSTTPTWQGRHARTDGGRRVGLAHGNTAPTASSSSCTPTRSTPRTAPPPPTSLPSVLPAPARSLP
jgi:hypothetical protein